MLGLVGLFHNPQNALPEIHGQRRHQLAADLGHEGVGSDLIVAAVGIVLILDGQLLTEHLADHLEQIAHAHGLVAGNDDVLIFKFRVKHHQGRGARVVHMHILPQRRRCAIIGDAAGSQRLVHKAVNGIAFVRPRPVQRAVAQNGVGQMMHGLIILNIDFAGLLAAPVKTTGLAVDIE